MMRNTIENLPNAFLQQLPYPLQKEVSALDPQAQNDFFTLFVKKQKSTGFAYLLWVFFGLHYAYVNKWGVQFLFWVTAGGLGLWWFIDLFRVPGIVRRYNHAQAMQSLMTIRMYR